jgi:hypothetical protein
VPCAGSEPCCSNGAALRRVGSYIATTPKERHLLFLRDVVHVAGHEQAASFGLYEQDSEGREHTISEGADLVWRALQDRANL